MKLKPRPTPPPPTNPDAAAPGALPSGFSKTTLAELGLNLPVGVHGAGGKLLKTFELRPWTMKEEVEVGKLKRPGMTTGRLVLELIGLFAVHVGGVKVGEMKKAERDLFLSTLYVPDALYIYTYLRREAKGSILPVKFTCPRCSEPIDLDGDLDGMDVVVVAERSAIQGKLELQSGIQYQGKRRTKVLTELARWSSMLDTKELGEGAMTRAMIEGSVVGFEDVPPEKQSPIPPAAFDDMAKADIDDLIDYISARTPGAQLIAETTCTKKVCAAEIIAPLNWQYDGFFETSSRRAPTRK